MFCAPAMDEMIRYQFVVQVSGLDKMLFCEYLILSCIFVLLFINPC